MCTFCPVAAAAMRPLILLLVVAVVILVLHAAPNIASPVDDSLDNKVANAVNRIASELSAHSRQKRSAFSCIVRCTVIDKKAGGKCIESSAPKPDDDECGDGYACKCNSESN